MDSNILKGGFFVKTKRLMATLLTLSLTASVALVGCGKNNDPKKDEP